jgi:hypothetical protein
VEKFKGSDSFYLESEAGFSKLFFGAITYLTLSPAIYIGKESRSLLSAKFGIIGSFDEMKAGFKAKRDLFEGGGDGYEAEWFATTDVGDDKALNLKIRREKELQTSSQNRLELSIFYYF